MALRAVVDHPKFKRLQSLLGRELRRAVTMREALGTLEAIWHFTGRYTPRGDIGRYPDEDIETWVEWDGEPGRLIGLLIESRWLDADADHRLLVHDWSQHADESTRKQLKRTATEFVSPTRPAAKRAQPVPVQPTTTHNTDKVSTCPVHVLDMSGLPGPVPGPEPEPEPEPGGGSGGNQYGENLTNRPKHHPVSGLSANGSAEPASSDGLEPVGMAVSGMIAAIGHGKPGSNTPAEAACFERDSTFSEPDPPFSDPDPAETGVPPPEPDPPPKPRRQPPDRCPSREDLWLEFLAAYPPRSGSRETARGKKAYIAVISRRLDPSKLHAEMLGGLARYTAWLAASGKLKTEFVQQIPTWINGRCWEEEYSLPTAQPGLETPDDVFRRLMGRETEGADNGQCNRTASSHCCDAREMGGTLAGQTPMRRDDELPRRLCGRAGDQEGDDP